MSSTSASCDVADLNTHGTFYCTRAKGHEGPCAAVPRSLTMLEYVEHLESELDRLRALLYGVGCFGCGYTGWLCIVPPGPPRVEVPKQKPCVCNPDGLELAAPVAGRQG